MATGYEVKMYNDINIIAVAMNRIANCLEAAELRARKRDAEREREAVIEKGIMATRPEDIEQMGKAIRAVVRGFAEMEADLQAKEEDEFLASTGRERES